MSKTARKGPYLMGVTNAILQPEHRRKMGPARWLYDTLVDMTTAKDEEGNGLVWGGTPVRHQVFEEMLGTSRGQHQSWLNKLRSEGYIETTKARHGIRVVVLASSCWKKRTAKALSCTEKPTAKASAVGKSEQSAVGKTQQPLLDHTIETNKKRDIKEIPPNPIQDLVIRFYEFQYQNFPKQLREFKKDPKKLIHDSVDVVEKLIRLDGYALEEVRGVLELAVKDGFWNDKVISLRGLRERKNNGQLKFDNMATQLRKNTGGSTATVKSWLMKYGERVVA